MDQSRGSINAVAKGVFQQFYDYLLHVISAFDYPVVVKGQYKG